MRSAPAVTVRCGGGPFWKGLLWALPAVASCAVAFWLARHAGLTEPVGLAVALVLGAASAWLAGSRPPRTPLLRWDGAAWSCDGEPVRPQVMIDSGGDWMLLRLQRLRGSALTGHASWVTVSKRDCAADWHGWRAAVYCPAPEPSARGGARQNP